MNNKPLIPIRPSIEDPQHILFDDLTDWRSDWWGMPEFSMNNAQSQYRITVHFLTAQDIKEFAKVTGLPVTARSDSAWFPDQPKLNPGSYYYDGPPADSRYPVCIPSKGRADCQKTGHALDRLGVTYRFFVEETEYNDYCDQLGESKVVKLPFHDLGQGSIPARNFIWEWAREREYKRHWTLDDNINGFVRCTENRRLRVYGGGFFRAMEDYVDRWENIAMAGPHHLGFVNDRSTIAPFLLNSRVYSCILLDTTLPHRWRGKYNEDTDLSLRLLKDGYCTLLFRAMCMDKCGTAYSKQGGMKGGNTDTVYATNDYRLEFAKSLQKQHPDCVKVTWKFNRWHHEVDYSSFKRNKPILKPGITKIPIPNNYGMELKTRSDQ